MKRSITDRKDRIRSAALVTVIHLALGWALVSSLGYRVIPRADDALKLFNLADQPPPPIMPPPEQTRSETRKPRDPEGAAAPPALKNTPTEIVTPKVEPLRPTPLPAAPVPGLGTAPAAGAAPTPGPGTGRGGIGNGLGSGMSGYGNGGGGNGRAASAQHVAGDIANGDYPPSAVNARAQGTTIFSGIVGPDGRLEDCRVIRSSGNRALDETTCRLALRRLRYRPATDAAGRPIASTVREEQSWELGPEQELPPDDERR